MQIVPITNANMTEFLPLIPKELLRQRVTLLGAMKDEVGCGLVAYEKLKNQGIILWLWVAPEWRRQGIAAVLLDAACENVFLRREQVHLCYKASVDGCKVLDLMLMRRGFLLQSRDVATYEVTGEALQNSPLMRVTKVGKLKETRIVPLEQVDVRVIRAGLVVCEEHGDYQISRADFSGADGKLSLVLLSDTKMVGCALVRKCTEQGCFELSTLYLKELDMNAVLVFLRTCVQNLTESEACVECVRIMTASERTQKIAGRLLGEGFCKKEEVHEAQMYREMSL